jgi:hypothetical protein
MPHDGRTEKTTDVWITPLWIVKACGVFDLDPCAATVRPWDCAAKNITSEQNGLLEEWHGRVWLNPPYAKPVSACKPNCRKSICAERGHVTEAVPGIETWMHRMAMHGNGIALVTPRTDSAWWHEWVLPYAKARIELRGRVRFCRADGSPGPAPVAPNALLAYSWADVGNLCSAARYLAGAVVMHPAEIAR